MDNALQSHRMNSFWGRLIGCALSILLSVATAGQLQAALKEPALQKVLQAAVPEDEIRVIVEFAQRPDLQSLRSMPRPQRRALMAREMKETAERDQQGVRSLLQNRGVRGIRHLWMINSLAVKAPAKVIQELAAHPDVQSLKVDRKITAAEILLQSFPPPEANIARSMPTTSGCRVISDRVQSSPSWTPGRTSTTPTWQAPGAAGPTAGSILTANT